MSEDDPEVKTSASLVTTTDKHFPSLASRLEYFSDFHGAKKAVVLCLFYIRKLRERIECRTRDEDQKFPEKIPQSVSFSQPTPARHVTVELMQQAEMTMIKSVQEVHYEEEIKALRSTPPESRSNTVKMSSPLLKLDPFFDTNGIFRVGGRLKYAELPERVKFPLILPGKNHVSHLIIKRCHEEVEHQGKGITLNEVRSRGYWLVGGSSVVSSYISKCVKCLKLRGVVKDQKMADLPPDRLEPVPPSTYCAVDYFGPWIIKDGRKELKRYGVLFTCMASTAIHLECANSMDTASLINALCRFICPRGPIRHSEVTKEVTSLVRGEN